MGSEHKIHQLDNSLWCHCFKWWLPTTRDNSPFADITHGVLENYTSLCDSVREEWWVCSSLFCSDRKAMNNKRNQKMVKEQAVALWVNSLWPFNNYLKSQKFPRFYQFLYAPKKRQVGFALSTSLLTLTAISIFQICQFLNSVYNKT